MKKYSENTDKFINDVVLPKLNLSEYTKENISDVVQYIFSYIEGPLSDKLEYSSLLEEEKELLQLASFTITEITTREDWDN